MNAEGLINQPALWNGKDLKGTWHVTIKIDGVRALWIPSVDISVERNIPGAMSIPGWYSRAGKPLYNIPDPLPCVTAPFWHPGNDCELYLGSLKDSIRACRTKHLKPDTPRITHEHLYSLDPLDPRLDLGLVEDPTAEWLKSKLASVNAQGYEGLVLRQGDKWLKVKPTDNYDVLVLGMFEGTGKHKGRMGYLITHMGKVGTGFTDEEREDWWSRPEPDTLPTIEVECMHLTPDGKFRHPRFVRERFDKRADK